MSVDLKTLTPDTSINDSAVLFGADSQASSTPSVYAVSTVRGHIVGTANTFTQPQVFQTSSATVPVNIKSNVSTGYIGLRILEAGGVAGTIQFTDDPVTAERGSFIVTASGNMRMYGTSTTEFYTASIERMRITSAGNVGIGTSSPTSARLVVETAALGATSGDTTGLIRTFTNTGNQDSLEFLYSRTASSPTAWTTADLIIRRNVDGTAAQQQIRFTGDAATTFWTNSNERMRITSAGNVGIGTSSPNAAALLDLTSTTQGFLPPRMTTAQRDLISSPPNGLVLYNTTTDKLQVRAAGAWVDLH
jgi:hypothetical protein